MSKIPDIEHPNYDDMAKMILRLTTQYRDLSQSRAAIVGELKGLFDKGYHLGLNKGWAIEQDS